MKPPVGLDLIYLYTYLISKRALNLSKFMFDNRKIVIFPFRVRGGGGAEAYGWTKTYLYTL